MKKLIIIITSVLFLSGCITKKQFHNTYGFADENKPIYNQDMINCKQYSYDTYPPKTFSMPTYYNPNAYANVGGIGGAMAQGRAMYAAEQAERQTKEMMKQYNKAREDSYNYCMQQKGWYEIEVEE